MVTLGLLGLVVQEQRQSHGLLLSTIHRKLCKGGW